MKREKKCFIGVRKVIQSSSSAFIIALIRSWTTVAACLLSRNTWASAFRGVHLLAGMSQFSSNGYRCWIGRSRKDFPAFNGTALTTPSEPGIGLSTSPSFHLPRLRCSPLISTTSPALTLIDLE